MKRIVVATLTMLVAILLLSVLLYGGDGKSVKKETPKRPQEQIQKPCQDKQSQDMCKGKDIKKCDQEKCLTACKEKHDKGECKDHDPAMCSAECLKKCTGHDNPPKK